MFTTQHSTINTQNKTLNNQHLILKTQHPLNPPNPAGECDVLPVLGPSQPLQHRHGHLRGSPQHWRGYLRGSTSVTDGHRTENIVSNIGLTQSFSLTFLLFQNQTSMLLAFAGCHIFAMSSVCSNPVMWARNMGLAWSLLLYNLVILVCIWSYCMEFLLGPKHTDIQYKGLSSNVQEKSRLFPWGHKNWRTHVYTFGQKLVQHLVQHSV